MNVFLAIIFFLFAVQALGDSIVNGISYSNWKEFSEYLKKDESLVIYYTFEKGSLSEKNVLKNQSQRNNASFFDAKLKKPQWTEGRWKEKTAIKLDDIPVVANPYNIENKQFTLEMWFKKNGAGAMRGNKNSKNGTLAGQSGYNSGWRISTNCNVDDREVIFSLGGKNTRFSIKSKNVEDKKWHYLAVTWNGKNVKIYIDGELHSNKPFSGPYTPVFKSKNWEMLKIGYADLGIGSVKLTVGEFAIYNRALSDRRIKAHRYIIQNSQ